MTNAVLKPVLDPEFVPAVLWNRTYRKRCADDPGSTDLAIGLSRPDGTTFLEQTRILPYEEGNAALTGKFVERMIKTLLWQKGGSRIFVGGSEPIAAMIRDCFSPAGARAFDNELIGTRAFGEQISVTACAIEDVPAATHQSLPLGRHLNGCRIGFDLGGSDRKAAALIDGEVVFSEEIAWDPYFQSDPQYHYDGINDSLKRAAAHLPRVDAIGGSAAGDYANTEVLLASLFRGISQEDFDKHIRRIFYRLKEEWGNVPFEVANDGEVTALAGSMSLKANGVLGISMGTSQAAGYCDSAGHITPCLNELAFTPIDYRDDAPADEWSGDIGCGVQYFSQQAVGRLAPRAGIELPDEMPFAEKLVEVQKLMSNGDERARNIYETIGTYFGYTIAHYAESYDIHNLLILGRVTSGEGGAVIIEGAQQVLALEFPELGDKIRISTPDEQLKRHGQAIAAASLPQIEK